MSPRLLIDPSEIAQKIHSVAKQLDADYAGKDFVLVAIMKGSICLVSDLMRALKVPFRLEVVQCSSYKGKVRGELQIFGLDRLHVEGKDLLVIDDIYDSGHTMDKLVRTLKEKGPRSVKSLVLLEKKVPRTVTHRPDYSLFQVENVFVIGYGLDEDELYRGLPGIYMKGS